MNKKKLLVSSLLTILVSTGLVVGATYSLFTSESTHNITVGSGIVKVTSSVDADSIEYYSMDVQQESSFENGGTAELKGDGTFELKNVTPGDSIKFKVKIMNESNVAVRYKVSFSKEEDALAQKLVLTGASVSKWTDLEPAPSDGPNLGTLTSFCELKFPDGGKTDNDVQTLNTSAHIKVLAIQANAPEAKDYTITFNSEYAKPLDATYQAGETIEIPELTYAGQIFGGWYTTSDYQEGTKFEGSQTMPQKDLVLYAKWTPEAVD